MKRKLKFPHCLWTLAALLTLGMAAAACSDDDNDKKGEAYDPSKPVVLESFAPTEGMLATQVILTGSNFGTDKERIHVFFNDKEASIISSSGNKILVLAPKLPGRYVDGELDNNCVVRVVVDGQEATASQTFYYNIQTNVTTVIGGDRSATTNPVGGEDLAEVQFSVNMNRPLVIDSEDNIYFILATGSGDNRDAVYVINEESGKLRVLDSNITTWLNISYLMYDPARDRCYRFFGNVGSHETYYYDRHNDFAQTRGFTFSWLRDDGVNDVPSYDGLGFVNTKEQWAVRPSDGMWYCRMNGGYFVKANPETGQITDISGRYDRRHDKGGSGFATTDGDCYGMAFDPTDDTKLYFTNTSLHAVMLYDFETELVTVYAGSSNKTSGWLDGRRNEALFNSPRQICIDQDRNMYVADYNNHCIRKIVMGTGYVSTMAGTPQTAGYQNGTGDMALFDHPVGIVLSKDGSLYVGDENNRAIRRIAIE